MLGNDDSTHLGIDPRRSQQSRVALCYPVGMNRRKFMAASGSAIAASALPPSASRAADEGKFDVVIAGGTPGGIATAIMAARLGRTVALVEYHRHLGGMSAGGLGASDIENRAVIQGLFREFVDGIHSYYVDKYGADSENVKLCRNGYWYEPSVAERMFDRMVAQHPTITVLKHHELIAVEKQTTQVVAARFKDRASGVERTLRGKVFIDATYEGDLYAAAGAAYRVGRESRTEFGEPHAGHIYANSKTKQIIGGTGKGDDRLPAYTFRLCLSSNPANHVPLVTPPVSYDRAISGLPRRSEIGPLWQLHEHHHDRLHIAPSAEREDRREHEAHAPRLRVRRAKHGISRGRLASSRPNCRANPQPIARSAVVFAE